MKQPPLPLISEEKPRRLGIKKAARPSLDDTAALKVINR
jgi:hypothetical protein